MKEKRSLEPSSSAQNGDQPDGKRQCPTLASVILEALKVDHLRKLISSSLEPVVRRVVKEEMEGGLVKMAAELDGSRSSMLNQLKSSLQDSSILCRKCKASPNKIEGPDGRNLQLRFMSKLSLPLFTDEKVKGEDENAILIVLRDVNTYETVTSGPESLAKLEVVVLEGDFNNDNADGLSKDDFKSHVLQERKGKKPLLIGNLEVNLLKGVGTLGELVFTDNSSWTKSRKFRLGLKVASGSCEGIRILEGTTDAFVVKDHRGKFYEKHFPPESVDEVWRLKNIAKDGCYHERLNKAGIHTVEQFLQFVVKDPQKLQNILKIGKSTRMWNYLVEHAKTCVPSGKVYIYYPNEPSNVWIVFNNIHAFIGVHTGVEFHSVNSLTENQKASMDYLVKEAYDNWTRVKEADQKSLMSSQNQLTSFENDSLTGNPVTIPSEHRAVEHGVNIEGYNNDNDDQYHIHQQSLNLDNLTHLECSHFLLHNQLSHGIMKEYMLDLDHTGEGTLVGGILDNGDIEHRLPSFNMGFYDHIANENSYLDEAYYCTTSTNFSFDKDKTGSSGKAVLGWLKLKAALRWGIFIRKKAAERRARIVELDDLYAVSSVIGSGPLL